MKRSLFISLAFFSVVAQCENDIEWMSTPGEVCACRGSNVSLLWIYSKTSNNNISAYTFCSNPLHHTHAGCETILLYRSYTTGTVDIHQTFKNKGNYIGLQNPQYVQGQWTSIGLKVYNVSDRDSAIYSVLIQGPAESSNGDCRLIVIGKIKYVYTIIHDSNEKTIDEFKPLNTSTTYIIDVHYDDIVNNATVTLKVNNHTEIMKQCQSPCSFEWQFDGENSSITATAEACGCSVTNTTRVQVINMESTSTEIDQSGQNHYPFFVSLSLVTISLLILIAAVVWKHKAIYDFVRKCSDSRPQQQSIKFSPDSESIDLAETVLFEHETAHLLKDQNIHSQLHQTLGPGEKIKQELIRCYSRKEFNILNPVVDDDTCGYHIDSVFVDVSLSEKEAKPIVGKRGLEESEQGKPVKSIYDMIPSPGSRHRVLLTGYAGSGKTSLCLRWIYLWAEGFIQQLQDYQLLIFLRARELEDNIIKSIATKLEGDDYKAIQNKCETLESVLSTNPPTLVIIDGYDEATEEQQLIVDNIISYKILPHQSVILTSRHNFFSGEVNTWYDTNGFDLEQQQTFIENFKLTLEEQSQLKYFNEFEETFYVCKHSNSILNSPMMIVMTCIMAASGEHVELDSRIQQYQNIAEYLIRRLKHKSTKNISTDYVRSCMSLFSKAVFEKLLKQNSFSFSRDEMLVFLTVHMLDNIILPLGYMSATNCIISGRKSMVYTFVHKSLAEFCAATYVISLPVDDRCSAVWQLFKSGAANHEAIRFTLGLCGLEDPEHIHKLFDTIVKDFKQPKIEDEAIQAQYKQILIISYGGKPNTYLGSSYLLLLLKDVDIQALSSDIVQQLSNACVVVRMAEIGKKRIEKRVKGIDLSRTDRMLAGTLYTGLLLRTHITQKSLDSVEQVGVRFVSNSPHRSIASLSSTLSECAPNMKALTKVHLRGLTSSAELGMVCRGLVASGLPCLTHFTFWGTSELEHESGCNIDPLVQLVNTAVKLRKLWFYHIHIGSKKQFDKLCAALEISPQLTHFGFNACSVSAKQVSDTLLPALQKRSTRLEKVELGVSGKREAKETLDAELKKLSDNCSIKQL